VWCSRSPLFLTLGFGRSRFKMPKMWQLPMFVVGVTLQVVSGARLDVVCPNTGGCKISIDGKVWSSTVDTMTRERGVVSYPIITRPPHALHGLTLLGV
jgi:hypothetical protein